MDNFMIGFLVIMGAMLLSRVLNDRANKMLDEEKKALLVDLFSGEAKYRIGLMIAIVGLFFLNIKWQFMDQGLSFLLYAFVLFVFLVASALLNRAKLVRAGYDGKYILMTMAASGVRMLGLVLFFVLLYVQGLF